MIRIVFFIFAISLQSTLFYYLWRRLIRDSEINSPWRRRLTFLFIALCVSIPISTSSRYFFPAIGQTVGWVSYFWLAISGLMTVGFLMIDFTRVLVWLGKVTFRRNVSPTEDKAEPSETLSRRGFLRRVTSGGVAVSATAISTHGALQALKTPDVVDRPIVLSRLPLSMSGFSILQITDLHIGNTIGEAFVSGVVHKVNAAKPDLIVITGDLVDGSVEDLREYAAPLAKLSAPHGVYFVTGNHEYYSGADSWIAHIRSLGIQVLRNERVEIGVGDDSFDLAGIDDHSSGRWSGHGPDLATAVSGRDESRELILLAHQPRQVHQAKKHGVGLQLSGHTHGGQVWPWHYIARLQQSGLLAGLSRHDDTQLYISRGTGYWGPPVRFLAKSEITRVILRSGKRL